MCLDGPEKPSITGPEVAKAGDSVTLSCAASSQPPSHFSWYFNSSLVANTSAYETGPLGLNMSGKYTCMAYNNITGQNSSAYMMLTVLGVYRRNVFMFLYHVFLPINNRQR